MIQNSYCMGNGGKEAKILGFVNLVSLEKDE